MPNNTSVQEQKMLVSIGLPVYNGERFLKEALDSLLAQDYDNFEITISDNASTDSTQEICENYAAQDKRIAYIRNKTNIGALKNFNQVLDLAKGEFFMWAAYDDLWEPSFMSTLYLALESCPDANLAFSMFDSVDMSGNHVRSYPRVENLSSISHRLTRANRFIWFPEYDGSANLVYGLMRTSAIKNIGGMRVYGRSEIAIDVLLLFRLALSGDFAINSSYLFHKRLAYENPTAEKWSFFDWVDNRGCYRKIIFQSSLPLPEKIVLSVSATIRQLIYIIKTPIVVIYAIIIKQFRNLASSTQY